MRVADVGTGERGAGHRQIEPGRKDRGRRDRQQGRRRIAQHAESQSAARGVADQRDLRDALAAQPAAKGGGSLVRDREHVCHTVSKSDLARSRC
jgi:hypothetical protein